MSLERLFERNLIVTMNQVTSAFLANGTKTETPSSNAEDNAWSAFLFQPGSRLEMSQTSLLSARNSLGVEGIIVTRIDAKSLILPNAERPPGLPNFRLQLIKQVYVQSY